MPDFESGAFNRALPPLRYKTKGLSDISIVPDSDCFKKMCQFPFLALLLPGL
jgi:hypothetical protein